MDSSAPSQIPSKRLTRIILGLASCLLVSLVAYRFSLWLDLRHQLANLKERKVPMSGAALDSWYARLPEAENAASVVMDAIRQHVELESNSRLTINEYDLVAAGKPLSPEVTWRATEYVHRNRETLKTLERVGEFRRARYPMDLARGMATPLPHLHEVKQLVNLWKWQAVLQSMRGEREAALHSISNGFALAATLRFEPIQISELVRIASISILMKGVEKVFSEHLLSEAELDQLNSLLKSAEEHSKIALPRVLLGERALAIEAFDSSARTLEGFTGRVGGIDGVSDTQTHFLETLLFQFRKLSGERDRDLTFYLRAAEKIENVSTNDFPAVRIQSETLEEQLIDEIQKHRYRYLVSRTVLPVPLTHTPKGEAFSIAGLRCCATAIAIERYRLRNAGVLAANLSALVPEFLSELPQDPFDGSLLRYQQESPRGYRVIATGSTEIRKRKASSWERKTQRDIEFSVRR